MEDPLTYRIFHHGGFTICIAKCGPLRLSLIGFGPFMSHFYFAFNPKGTDFCTVPLRRGSVKSPPWSPSPDPKQEKRIRDKIWRLPSGKPMWLEKKHVAVNLIGYETSVKRGQTTMQQRTATCVNRNQKQALKMNPQCHQNKNLMRLRCVVVVGVRMPAL